MLKARPKKQAEKPTLRQRQGGESDFHARHGAAVKGERGGREKSTTDEGVYFFFALKKALFLVLDQKHRLPRAKKNTQPFVVFTFSFRSTFFLPPFGLLCTHPVLACLFCPF